jgi:hypothetical protein
MQLRRFGIIVDSLQKKPFRYFAGGKIWFEYLVASYLDQRCIVKTGDASFEWSLWPVSALECCHSSIDL